MSVTLYHPVLDRTTTVSPGLAKALRRRGWTDPVDPAAGPDPLAELTAEAEVLGVSIDGRWGAPRLAAEIAAHRAVETHVPEGDDPTPIEED